jgi:hypothetical protein
VYSLVNEIRDGEEKMVKSFTRIASLMALVFATQGAMALPDLGSKLKGMASKQDATEAAGSDAGVALSAADAQESIIVEFREILRDVTIAQAAVIKALGLKDDAEAVQADVNAFSGECDNKCLDEAIARSDELNETIATALADSEAMKNISREEAAKATLPWLQAGYRTAMYVPKLTAWGQSATGEIKGAGVMGAAKMKKKFSQGFYIVRKAPPAAAKWLDTIRLAREVFAQNNIALEGADEFDF